MMPGWNEEHDCGTCRDTGVEPCPCTADTGHADPDCPDCGGSGLVGCLDC